jgi:hypothetical protein
VGKWWWATVVALLGIIALIAFVHQFRRHTGWLVAAGLAVLLVGSFIAYHKEHSRTKETPVAAKHEYHFHDGSNPHFFMDATTTDSLVVTSPQPKTQTGIHSLDLPPPQVGPMRVQGFPAPNGNTEDEPTLP